MTVLTYQGLSAEQREIETMAVDYLAVNTARADAGAELGWFGIGIPESVGGSGGELCDLAPIIAAAGSVAAATTVGWAAGVIGRLLIRYPGAEELTAGVASGQLSVALPVRDAAAITPDDRRSLLVHGSAAPTHVLLPVAGESQSLAFVPTDPSHVLVTAVESLDQTRQLHRVAFVEGLDTAALPTISGDRLYDRLRIHIGLVAALDSVGAARAALAATLDYAVDRRQFGREIGSFQAYKHRCANAFTSFSLAQSAAHRAAHDHDDVLALAAAIQGTKDSTFVCGEAVQLHGAIGFSWETGLHTHLKRARHNQIIANSSDVMAETLLSVAGFDLVPQDATRWTGLRATPYPATR